ncbi:MAG: NUDIX domain-containing protein [Candidatus Lokiarchaeota archaeon]|nr:NUDIX domain-containing protein [Candidatus Lokiarchaeota archaeon]
MDLEVVWEGNLLLEKVSWGKKAFSEYTLPPELDLKRKINWKNHLRENKADYDGNLLFLEKFFHKKNELILDVGLIKFSTVIFIEKNKLYVDKGIGMLGVQCLIFSPCHRYILVGERSLSQSYYPGITTVPGGMLELDDLEKGPKKAFMREIYEETSLLFQPNVYLYAILLGWNNVSVTFLTSVTIIQDYKFNPADIIIGDKKEWENNLRWLQIEELKDFPLNRLLDGLYYFQKRISNFTEN